MDVCLECRLAVCDESDPSCGFKAEIAEKQRAYYEANKAEIAADSEAAA